MKEVYLYEEEEEPHLPLWPEETQRTPTTVIKLDKYGQDESEYFRN